MLLERSYDPDTFDQIYTLKNTLTGVETVLRSSSNTNLTAAALNENGKTVIGTYNTVDGAMAFIWTGGVFTDLGQIDGGTTRGVGISADGTVATGNATVLGLSEAFIWTRAEGIRTIGDLGGESVSYNISGDGSTVIGNSKRAANGNYFAFAWSSSGGMVDIDADTVYARGSVATLVSYNGTAVAGLGYSASSVASMFYWTSAGMIDVGNLGGNGLDLTAMSSDGSVVVGYGGDMTGYYRAFRYTAGSIGLENLGTLTGGTYSKAYDVNADGTVIVGEANDATSTTHGFRWTEAAGMQTVEQWLAENGANIGDAATKTAELVSDDGNVIVGKTTTNSTYIARVGDASAGIIDTEQFLPTVAAVGDVVVQNGIYHANTIMFGAQGAPMRNLLSAGQRSAWGTVDGGYDNTDNAGGGLSLGEFGLGYGLGGGVTARLSVGGVYTNQDLDAGGDIRQRGFYVSPEASINLGSNVFVTVGGYWGRSSIDTHRGYLNGNVQDYSDGSTRANTWGAKLRADWLDAVTINDTAITPYAALSYVRTKVNAYTEGGGSFPVNYDAAGDHATIARIGADFVHPLMENVRFLAKAEADYQVGDHATGTKATVAGLSFELAGAETKNFWLRGGIGAEFDVGSGVASVMVNGTTSGSDPDVWVRTNFTVKF